MLVDRRGKAPVSVWPVRYHTMFHMTNDSGKFVTEAELAERGAYPVAANRWRMGAVEWVPLYEGKMVQAYDHRAASIVVNAENINRPAQPAPVNPVDRKRTDWLPSPQFWVDTRAVELPPDLSWLIAFKDVTSPTNARTMIAAALPVCGLGNTLPALLPYSPLLSASAAAGPSLSAERMRQACTYYRRWAPLLLANMSALPFDFIARQKVQGVHLNFYIVEQLPVVPLDGFARPIGSTTAEALVRDHVLRLTYTAHDMAGFAADMGHAGPPFPWDDEVRLHLRARLDALFFILYGMDRDTAAYVLSTFPIVREEEEKRFGGRFRSRDLILGYMAAFAAGDTDSRIAA